MLTSILSFLMGWIMIAHAPKPTQNTTVSASVSAPYPTLAPLPSVGTGIDQNTGNFLQGPSLSLQPSNNNFAPAPMPVFRTSGS
jgi:hypothetical protein